MAKRGAGSRQRSREGIKYFNGSFDQYIRVQPHVGNEWSVIVATSNGTSVLPVPSRRWAFLTQKALIELGHEAVMKYLWEEEKVDVSAIEAEEGPEASKESEEQDAASNRVSCERDEPGHGYWGAGDL